jgi:hypothetical protein
VIAGLACSAAEEFVGDGELVVTFVLAVVVAVAVEPATALVVALSPARILLTNGESTSVPEGERLPVLGLTNTGCVGLLVSRLMVENA